MATSHPAESSKTTVLCQLDTERVGLELECQDGALTGVRFIAAVHSGTPPTSGVLQQATQELEQYLRGERRRFTVPLRFPPGTTPHQRRVWDALLRIPYGETRSYGELARELGSSPRAVGGACRRNPLPLFVPCHRVVAQHSSGGYAGDWEKGKALEIKRWLLRLESAGCPDPRSSTPTPS